jgi:hypothetical protein
MTRTELENILKKFVPDGAEKYATDLLVRHKIQLHIKPPRSTKYGDYRPPLLGEDHRISLNRDLNQYAFMVTFLHEVAHLLNHELYRGRVMPHGAEWKKQFKVVSLPIFELNVLPVDVRNALGHYLSNPAASSCSDPQLFRTLRKYDPEGSALLVEEIPFHSRFKLQDGRQFLKISKNRTRYTCKEVSTGRIYLVPGLATCEIVTE